MNQIQIKRPLNHDNEITYCYEIKGEWVSAFTELRKIKIRNDCDISNVPESVLIVPFLANILPMAWVYDAEIKVDSCDSDFYECLENVKSGYRDMYPMMQFGGRVICDHIVNNNSTEITGALAFFSGGVDAFNTLTQHLDEKPVLFTLWGADVKLFDEAGWENVYNHLQDIATEFDVSFISSKSEFRIFQNTAELTEKVKISGDGWWHGFQHGIGIISHAAPVMYALGKKTVYFASSFTAADTGKVTCASDPTIDNFVKFCGCNVVHDGYEFTRQMKVHNITQFAKRTGKKIPLRVCWESTGGSNCCNCEKCWRTILGVYAEGFNPRNFGFEYDDFAELSQKIYKNRELLKWHRESRYAPMQEVLRKNYTIKTVDPSLRWFYRIDINQLGEVPFYRKVIRKCRHMAGKVKHKLFR